MKMLYPNGSAKRPKVSSPYGPRDGSIGVSNFHAGADFIGFATIKAVADGNVTYVGWLNNAAGNTIRIDHGGGVQSTYMHNASHKVKKGQRVTRGQAIAVMGSTGNATGDCSHLEIRLNGKSTDPVPYIAARVFAGSGAPVYPLPSGWYFGPKSGPMSSVSGYYGHRDDLKRWQQRMKDRGWDIVADGLYGSKTRAIAKAFQREKGLKVDGLIGPATWAAAWTAPVT